MSTSPELDDLLDNYNIHRIGSHSDDWGGDSDKPCFCDLKPLIQAHTAQAVQQANKSLLRRMWLICQASNATVEDIEGLINTMVKEIDLATLSTQPQEEEVK